jgi:hypothetical protein
MSFLGHWLERLGLVARQPSRTVTLWIGHADWLQPAVQMAAALQRHFPRTRVVMVQPEGSARTHGFPSTAAAPWAARLLMKRLRTRTLVLAGVPSPLAARLTRLAQARGAGVVRLDRNAAAAPSPHRSDWQDGVDAIVDVDELAADPQAVASLSKLITRSRREALRQRGTVPPRTRLMRLLRTPRLWTLLLGRRFREYRSVDELREALGRPGTLLCLGNGPSSEHPGLRHIAFDRLFRVNMSWSARGFLTCPDLVFTGLPEAVLALRPPAGFVFGSINSEERVLGRLLPTKRRFAFATAERLGLFDYAGRSLAPTNGALMIALAVELRPARLVVAGIDLFSDPAGAYPGDGCTGNAYDLGHDASLELRFITAALRRFQGELIVFGEPLRRALEPALSTPKAS